jgi:hypothetical protein
LYMGDHSLGYATWHQAYRVGGFLYQSPYQQEEESHRGTDISAAYKCSSHWSWVCSQHRSPKRFVFNSQGHA